MIPSIDKDRHGFDGQKCADAHQGKKDKKRRKDALSGCLPLSIDGNIISPRHFFFNGIFTHFQRKKCPHSLLCGHFHQLSVQL